MSILVFVDQAQGTAKQVSWEIMGKARELAGKTGVPVVALVVGEGAAKLAGDAAAFGADRVLVVEGAGFEQFRTGTWAAALKAAVEQAQPRIVLASSNPGMRDAVAMAACDLNIGLAADCQDLSLDEQGNLLAVRPVFSGNILTTVKFKGTPQMATVRGRSFPMPERSDKSVSPEPLQVPAEATAGQEEILSFEPAQTSELGVEQAAIIVSGGRGVKGPEGFEPIRQLAEVLGAAVGASRAAVDAGWIPYKHQVGQTGKTVRPDLYIACGISGAIQHMAGMGNAKVIVAINKDKDAPIFTIARYGIIGDLFEVVPALTQAFKQKLGK